MELNQKNYKDFKIVNLNLVKNKIKAIRFTAEVEFSDIFPDCYIQLIMYYIRIICITKGLDIVEPIEMRISIPYISRKFKTLVKIINNSESNSFHIYNKTTTL